MIKRIFEAVARWLQRTASLTHISYEEANIILYYIIAPLIYAALIDSLTGRNWVKIGYAVAFLVGFLLIGRGSFRAFSDKLFIASVRLLDGWNRMGLDYVKASVVFCVIIPGIALITLVSVNALAILK